MRESKKQELDSDQVRGLVDQCVEQILLRGDGALESFCAEHPAHAARIRARIARLERLGLLTDVVAPTDDVPRHLGPFEIIRRLGGGGMGVVYLARQAELDREVALKIIRPDQVLFDSARSRFEREATVLASLKHPNIVPVHTFGNADGAPYFSMEYVEGKTLAEVLAELKDLPAESLTGADLERVLQAPRAGRRTDSSVEWHFDPAGSWQEACLKLVVQAARALEHAHGRNVLHRDVKPSNLMLANRGRLMLFDFGLATSGRSARITRTGSVLGSLAYMSPEQVEGQPADARSDIYSLGVTMYELLTLQNPFVADSVEATHARVLRGAPPPPRTINPRIAWDMETVCLTAMEANPARRYASVSLFLEDLQNLLHLLPIKARRPSAVLRARRFARRRPTLTAIALLLGLIVLVAPLAYGLVMERANRAVRAKNDELRQALSDLKEGVDLTLDTIDEALFQLGDHHLRALPGMQQVRAELLGKALRNLDRLEALRPDDPELLSRRVALHNAQAIVLDGLGRTDEALRSYEAGIALGRQLLESDGDHPERARDLIKQLMNASGVYRNRGDLQRADDRSRESRSLLEQSIERFPEDLELRISHTWAVAEDAELCDASTRPLERQQKLARALEVTEALLRDYPADADAQNMWALTRSTAAAWHVERGEFEACLQRFEESIAVLERLVSRRPDYVPYHDALVRVTRNLGVALLQQDDLERAREVIERGLGHGRELVRRCPFVVEYEVQLAGLCIARGMLDDGQQARVPSPFFLEAQGLLEDALRRSPDRLEIRSELAVVLTNIASQLRIAGDLDSSEAHAEEARKQIDSVLASNPTRPKYQAQATTVRLLLGHLACQREDPMQAAALLEDSIAELRVPDHLWPDIATLWNQIAACADARGDIADGDVCVEHALDALHRAVQLGQIDGDDLAPDGELAAVFERYDRGEIIRTLTGPRGAASDQR